MQEQAQLADTARKDAAAPHPDDPRKPDSPTEITGTSWQYVVKRALAEFTHDQCTDLAGALTYFAVLSLFPGLLAVLSLLGVFGQGEATAAWLIDFLSVNAPKDLVELLADPIRQISTQGGSGLALVTGILGALWAASGYVGAFGRAMNKVYEVEEGRTFVRLRAMNLAVTLGMVVGIVGVLGLFLLGGDFGAVLLGPSLARTLGYLAWPVAVVVGVVLLALLYYMTPNVQQPKFRWVSIGAGVALAGMGLAAFAFTFYVSNFSKFNAMYGTIGSVIVLLLGLWIMNNVMLFGAELDAELERGRQLQAGIKAEKSIQLPPRDTRGVEKQTKKAAELVEQARALRRTQGEQAEPGASRGSGRSDADRSGRPGAGTRQAGAGARDHYADPELRRQLRLDVAG